MQKPRRIPGALLQLLASSRCSAESRLATSLAQRTTARATLGLGWGLGPATPRQFGTASAVGGGEGAGGGGGGGGRDRWPPASSRGLLRPGPALSRRSTAPSASGRGGAPNSAGRSSAGSPSPSSSPHSASPSGASSPSTSSAAAEAGSVRRMGSQRHVLRSSNSVQNVCVQDILGRHKMNAVFEVIIVRSDGRTLEPSEGLSASELGLHSRDLSLFAADSRLSPQRATIAVRGDRILFRTEAIKAVIEKDQCTLIKNKRDRDFHDIIKPMTLVIEAQPHVPFELSVLEVLLHVTLLYFERRRAHISWMVERIIADGGGGGGAAANGGEGPLGSGDPFGGIGESTVQQFVPLEKVLTSVLNDAKETCDAIKKFLDDDSEAASGLLLSLPPLPPVSRGGPGPDGSRGADSCGPYYYSGGREMALGVADFATSDHYRVSPPAPASSPSPSSSPASSSASSSHPIPASSSAPASAVPPLPAFTSPPVGAAGMAGAWAAVAGGAAAGPGADAAAAAAGFGMVAEAEGEEGGADGAGGDRPGGGAGGAAAAGRPFGVVPPSIGGFADPARRREAMRNQALEDAARILETYGREVESIVGSLLETEDFLESTRDTYRMQLDSSRNHIILVNLWISVASISLMVATLPSALFGMNVQNGLEEAHGAFLGMIMLSAALAFGSYPAFMSHFTNRFMRASRQDMHNMRMLRTFLMQHSDDLEAIVDAMRRLPAAAAADPHPSLSAAARRLLVGQQAQHGGGGAQHGSARISVWGGGSGMSREAFRRHMRAQLPKHVRLSGAQLDYLFSQFDRDKDGVLTEAEATLSSCRAYSDGVGVGGAAGDPRFDPAWQDRDRGDAGPSHVMGSDGDVMGQELGEDEDLEGATRLRGLQGVAKPRWKGPVA
ncbi:hypothetical protein HYH03_006149 [Edaphochlamys debaryana]|uniref:EF-hand domain-containing protein n=1 Tax=Edaphochlamys debaryana TaxID=47281 RepID=A0A836C1I3_9CHLO|nr:hypothetical protein HYH03_006149 [Edaphochlamys debaryana]|eukprot:KAG2495912.1 hypothetical protein HYH03_006149 [Edaphochlamys debaryana]